MHSFKKRPKKASGSQSFFLFPHTVPVRSPLLPLLHLSLCWCCVGWVFCVSTFFFFFFKGVDGEIFINYSACQTRTLLFLMCQNSNWSRACHNSPCNKINNKMQLNLSTSKNSFVCHKDMTYVMRFSVPASVCHHLHFSKVIKTMKKSIKPDIVQG